MAKTMNPPKKHKYQVRAPKKEPALVRFFTKYKKLLLIITAAVLALAILVTGLVIFLKWLLVSTPYDFINLGKHISVPVYKGVEIKQTDIDDTFAREKKSILREYATFTDVTDGLIEKEYNVKVDTKGYLIGENGERAKDPFSGSVLTDYEITDIGDHYTSSGSKFSEEIQNGLIGKSAKANTKVTISFKYDDDHNNEELRGKNVEFDITVKSVTKTNYPEYTDAFVKEKTGYETITALEEYLREEITLDLLWTEVVNKVEVTKFPKRKMNENYKQIDAYYNAYMAANKLSWEKLLSDVLQTTEEGYNAMRQQRAERTVKEEMVLYYIVKEEKIRLSRKDYKAGARELAELEGYETIRELEKSIGKDIVERSIKWDIVKQLVKDNANIIK